MKKKAFVLLLMAGIFGLCIIACSKSSSSNNAGLVNVTLDFSLPQYASLNAVAGYYYYPNAGIKGIIIYRVSSSQFNCYEANCTYNPTATCAPMVVQSSFYVVDTCKNCGSKFLLVDGSVNKGPATVPMTQYKVNYDGVTTLHITN